MAMQKNPVDCVLDRMVEAMLGAGAQFRSHALALNIPRETIKSWKRRGEVPLPTLKGFALDWKVSLDWLLHGDEAAQAASLQAGENVRPYGLGADESALLESYRRAPADVRAALLVVLGHLGAAAAPRAEIPMPAHIEVRESNLPVRKFSPPREKGLAKKKGGAE